MEKREEGAEIGAGLGGQLSWWRRRWKSRWKSQRSCLERWGEKWEQDLGDAIKKGYLERRTARGINCEKESWQKEHVRRWRGK